MVKKCCVLFQKLSAEKGTFKIAMVRLGVTPDIVEQMIRKAPIILKGDLSLEAARRYADAVRTDFCPAEHPALVPANPLLLATPLPSCR